MAFLNIWWVNQFGRSHLTIPKQISQDKCEIILFRSYRCLSMLDISVNVGLKQWLKLFQGIAELFRHGLHEHIQ